ncbi:MAG: MFS transporter [Candidatus Competibacteraceae bacterium]|nr:MFS transporter [Candidatus Competibacteraceae bacterium]
MTPIVVNSSSESRSMAVIVFAGGLILALSFGIRSVFGGFLDNLSNDLFGGRVEVLSFSIAIQNLIWGLAQPAFGMVADRFGDRRALWLGFGCYAAGMVLCIAAMSPIALHLGAGVLVGMGISGTAFGVVLAVIGRAAPVEKREYYLGLASALGSVGQVLLPLLASWLTEWLDWRVALAVIAAMLVPMALCIPLLRVQDSPLAPTNTALTDCAGSISLAQTVKEAFRQPSYVLLCIGFSVCGFHLAFITAHLPTYVQYFCSSTSMSPEELRTFGLRALSVVGLANIFGTLLASKLGLMLPKSHVLAGIYALRAVIITISISFPITPTSVIVFATAMGVLWLSTVPLTSGLVLNMFGPQAMGTLFGFVFLSHPVWKLYWSLVGWRMVRSLLRLRVNLVSFNWARFTICRNSPTSKRAATLTANCVRV